MRQLREQKQKRSISGVVVKFLATILVVLCVVSSSEGVVCAKSATDLKTSLAEKEAAISAAKKEREMIKSKVTDIKKIKKKLEAERADLKNYVTELDSQATQIQEKIDALTQEISDKEEQIAQTQEQLEAAQETQEKQYESMVIRMRQMYEQGDDNLLFSILEAGSFREMINRVQYIEKVVTYDKERYEEYQANTEYIAACKEQLDVEKELLDETKAASEEEEKALEELIKDKQEQIAEYNKSIAAQQTLIGEYEEDLSAADEEIRALEKAIANQKKKEGGGSLIYDGGMFKFPLASYTRVSDDYGNRIHPITGKQQFHGGIDFAAPKGTAIYAAYDGQVVAATYNASMGNYVMIDHGNDLYTVYMHASALYVKAGDSVSKGAHIAAVGTTGRSTGNHLHFAVRKNGNYVSPWDYISK